MILTYPHLIIQPNSANILSIRTTTSQGGVVMTDEGKKTVTIVVFLNSETTRKEADPSIGAVCTGLGRRRSADVERLRSVGLTVPDTPMSEPETGTGHRLDYIVIEAVAGTQDTTRQVVETSGIPAEINRLEGVNYVHIMHQP